MYLSSYTPKHACTHTHVYEYRTHTSLIGGVLHIPTCTLFLSQHTLYVLSLLQTIVVAV